MKTEIYSVKLKDEMPRIGCGSRIVRVRVGRKWVRVTDNHPNPNHRSRQRVHVRTWNNLDKELIEDLGDIAL
jgi:hypothetical protein